MKATCREERVDERRRKEERRRKRDRARNFLPMRVHIEATTTASI